MGDYNPFAGSSASSGFDPFAGSSGGTKHHSLLSSILHEPTHIAGNLLKDIRDSAVGLPQGLVHLAEHPIGSAELIGKTTWKDWSPLFHGHPGEWAKQFAAHPLAPILDVAAFVTGGASLAARGGHAAGELGLLSKESRLAQLGGTHSLDEVTGKVTSSLTHEIKVPGSDPAYRQFSANPVVRARQQAMVHLGEHLSVAAPKWFGTTEKTALDGTTALHKGHVADLSQLGYANRYFARQESYRAGATKAAVGAQVAAFVKGGKDITQQPEKMFQLIDDHGRAQLIAHAHKLSFGDAHKLRSGLVFIKDDKFRNGLHDKPHVSNLEAFKNAMGGRADTGRGGFADRHTTSDIKHAVIDEHGKYLVVYKRGVAAYGKEGANSVTFLTKLYRYPTQAWKYMVLATRPAYFVNNAVGNTFMAMAHLGPVGFSRGLADAYRQVHGERATAKSIESASGQAMHHLAGDWQQRKFLAVHQGFGQEAIHELKLHSKIREAGHDKVATVVKHAEHGLYPVTHQVSDLFLRRTMLNELARRDPLVKAEMKKGSSFNRAADKVSDDPGVRDRWAEQVNHALGDYHHLNPLERHIKDFVPFYTWDRAIARHGVNMALEQPAKVAAAAQVGQMGSHDTTNALGGAIPGFLKGIIPLGKPGADGRMAGLSTAGLNPYATLPDAVDTVGSLVGIGSQGAGSTFAGQLNPLITGAIEATTGQSLLSGAKLPHHGGGILGSIIADVVGSLPQVKLATTLIHGESQPKPNKRTGVVTPFLYKKDLITQLESLFGVPIKKVSTEAAAKAAKKRKTGF
jgi:hypothetical protein